MSRENWATLSFTQMTLFSREARAFVLSACLRSSFVRSLSRGTSAWEREALLRRASLTKGQTLFFFFFFLHRVKTSVFLWQTSLLVESWFHGNCYREKPSSGASKEHLFTGYWLEKKPHILDRCPGTSVPLNWLFRGKASNLDRAYRWVGVAILDFFPLTFWL